MLQSLMLVLALCTDTFVASVAYGANRIEVAFGKALLLNGICSVLLWLAFKMGFLLDALVPERFTRLVCCGSLFLLGLWKFLDYGIKAYINRRWSGRYCRSFSLSDLQVIVNIYANPMAADADDSKSLGWRETVFLALAMSVDSVTVGTMAAFLQLKTGITLFLCFAVGTAMMEAGLRAGRKMARWRQCDLGWVSGLLLMGLALTRL